MTTIPLAPNLNTKMRKFRFIVLNNGQNGQMNMNEQPQIAMAPSPQYLVNLYAATGDMIRILEELPPDNETRNYGKLDIEKDVNAMSTQGWQASGAGLSAGKMMDFSGSNEQIEALKAMHSGGQAATTQPSPQQPEAQPPVQQDTIAQRVEPAQPAAPSPAKYFNVNGMECKMENGRLYQKHWIAVSESEMANYRLISDKNNKILPMAGKHLEVLKWVIVEEDANG